MSLIIRAIAAIIILGSPSLVHAQAAQGGTFGFGIILGDPTGGTAKIVLDRGHAMDFYIGGSYFGGLRIGGDYLWSFDAFRSDVAKMYAGPGITLGLGHGGGVFWYRDKNGWWYSPGSELALGVRAIFGVSVMPRSTPLEIFLELGPLLGLAPGFGAAIDLAVGIRFYP